MNDSTLVRKVQAITGWNTVRMAKEFGVTRFTVINWRNGNVRMHKRHLDNLKRIAAGKAADSIDRMFHVPPLPRNGTDLPARTEAHTHPDLSLDASKYRDLLEIVGRLGPRDVEILLDVAKKL